MRTLLLILATAATLPATGCKMRKTTARVSESEETLAGGNPVSSSNDIPAVPGGPVNPDQPAAANPAEIQVVSAPAADYETLLAEVMPRQEANSDPREGFALGGNQWLACKVRLFVTEATLSMTSKTSANWPYPPWNEKTTISVMDAISKNKDTEQAWKEMKAANVKANDETLTIEMPAGAKITYAVIRYNPALCGSYYTSAPRLKIMGSYRGADGDQRAMWRLTDEKDSWNYAMEIPPGFHFLRLKSVPVEPPPF